MSEQIPLDWRIGNGTPETLHLGPDAILGIRRGRVSVIATLNPNFPPFAPISRRIAAVPRLLDALDVTRNYLWGVLCREELTTASNHPAADLYRQVEEAIEKARFG